MAKSILTCLIVLQCLSFISGCRNQPEKSPAEKTVVVYCSADQDFAEPILERFGERMGIKVLPRFDVEATKTMGLVQRLRSEASNPQADVYWSNEIFETVRLAKDGILGTFTSEVTKNWPKAFADPQGRWYGFGQRARVIAYNTRLVKKGEAPRSIEDLVDPRWKGRVLMARPQFGTTRGHMAAIWIHYGPEKATAIYKGLKQNGIRMVNGNSTAARMVAEGQAWACLTDTDDVWVGQRNGWPLELVYPRHGEAGTLVIPNTVGLVQGAKHPQEAGALIEYLLSEEVERALAESDSHNVPVRMELAGKFPRYRIPEPMKVDYTVVAEGINSAVQAVTKALEK